MASAVVKANTKDNKIKANEKLVNANDMVDKAVMRKEVVEKVVEAVNTKKADVDSAEGLAGSVSDKKKAKADMISIVQGKLGKTSNQEQKFLMIPSVLNELDMVKASYNAHLRWNDAVRDFYLKKLPGESLGMTLTKKDGKITITKLNENDLLYKNGFVEDDVIINVNDEDPNNTDNAIELLNNNYYDTDNNIIKITFIPSKQRKNKDVQKFTIYKKYSYEKLGWELEKIDRNLKIKELNNNYMLAKSGLKKDAIISNITINNNYNINLSEPLPNIIKKIDEINPDSLITITTITNIKKNITKINNSNENFKKSLAFNKLDKDNLFDQDEKKTFENIKTNLTTSTEDIKIFKDYILKKMYLLNYVLLNINSINSEDISDFISRDNDIIEKIKEYIENKTEISDIQEISSQELFNKLFPPLQLSKSPAGSTYEGILEGISDEGSKYGSMRGGGMEQNNKELLKNTILKNLENLYTYYSDINTDENNNKIVIINRTDNSHYDSNVVGEKAYSHIINRQKGIEQQKQNGIKIKELSKKNLLLTTEIYKGDTIYEINRIKITTAKQLNDILNDYSTSTFTIIYKNNPEKYKEREAHRRAINKQIEFVKDELDKYYEDSKILIRKMKTEIARGMVDKALEAEAKRAEAEAEAEKAAEAEAEKAAEADGAKADEGAKAEGAERQKNFYEWFTECVGELLKLKQDDSKSQEVNNDSIKNNRNYDDLEEDEKNKYTIEVIEKHKKEHEDNIRYNCKVIYISRNTIDEKFFTNTTYEKPLDYIYGVAIKDREKKIKNDGVNLEGLNKKDNILAINNIPVKNNPQTVIEILNNKNIKDFGILYLPFEFINNRKTLTGSWLANIKNREHNEILIEESIIKVMDNLIDRNVNREMYFTYIDKERKALNGSTIKQKIIDLLNLTQQGYFGATSKILDKIQSGGNLIDGNFISDVEITDRLIQNGGVTIGDRATRIAKGIKYVTKSAATAIEGQFNATKNEQLTPQDRREFIEYILGITLYLYSRFIKKFKNENEIQIERFLDEYYNKLFNELKSVNKIKFIVSNAYILNMYSKRIIDRLLGEKQSQGAPTSLAVPSAPTEPAPEPAPETAAATPTAPPPTGAATDANIIHKGKIRDLYKLLSNKNAIIKLLVNKFTNIDDLNDAKKIDNPKFDEELDKSLHEALGESRESSYDENLVNRILTDIFGNVDKPALDLVKEKINKIDKMIDGKDMPIETLLVNIQNEISNDNKNPIFSIDSDKKLCIQLDSINDDNISILNKELESGNKTKINELVKSLSEVTNKNIDDINNFLDEKKKTEEGEE